MKITDLISALYPLREQLKEGHVDYLSKYPEVRYDYLTIYSEVGKVLARSERGGCYDTLRVEYEGLIFLASPGYGDSDISIEFYSLSEKATLENHLGDYFLEHLA